MPLKIATWDDYSDIQSMIMKFGQTMYSGHFEFDEYKVAQGITDFLNAPGTEKIVILATTEDGTNVGLIAGVCSEAPFSTKKLAYEMVWWMEPQYRKSRLALELSNAFEYWTQKVGADINQMSLVECDHSDSLEKYYKRKGYTLLERGFIRNNTHARS